MSFLYRRSFTRLFLTLILATCLQAAPRKRCNDSSQSIQLDSSTTPTPPTALSVIPIPTSDYDPDLSNTQSSISTSTSSMDTNTDADTTTPSPTPVLSDVLLIYANSTRTVAIPSIPNPDSYPTTTTITTTTSRCHDRLPDISTRNAIFSNTTTTTTTTTPTRTTRSHTHSSQTTPDMDSMQTAYYLDTCSWESHQDDAICLGGNTMMCCRSDNAACNSGILMDGGLSCEGIQSGDWATVWSRPTVFATAGG